MLPGARTELRHIPPRILAFLCAHLIPFRQAEQALAALQQAHTNRRQGVEFHPAVRLCWHNLDAALSEIGQRPCSSHGPHVRTYIISIRIRVIETCYVRVWAKVANDRPCLQPLLRHGGTPQM